MQTKAFAIFFLVLAIVNIPLCMVFAFGNGELISKAASDQLTDMFSDDAEPKYGGQLGS